MEEERIAGRGDTVQTMRAGWLNQRTSLSTGQQLRGCEEINNAEVFDRLEVTKSNGMKREGTDILGKIIKADISVEVMFEEKHI